MAATAVYFSFIVCLYYVNSLNLPGPLVYVVTPSPRTPAALKIDEGRSAPFYYHNWMRRMDSPQNASSTTTTTTPKVETPDLIFAEFESHNGDSYSKSLRNLLEKEKIQSKSSTTTKKPIYVPDDVLEQTPEVNYAAPDSNTHDEDKLKARTPDMTDYFALYNNLYGNNDAAPVFIPTPTTASTTTTTTTSAPKLSNVEDIWHVIDSEKHNQFAGQWEEVPVDAENDKTNTHTMISQAEPQKEDKTKNEDVMDDNFALPGFGTNPGNGAENESRAIRTEPNIRFPYINLKPFQVKKSFANNKKTNNGMFTNLDNFHEITNPVRGEAQEVMPARQPIDRYNPAQPYLPPSRYGNLNTKQDSSANSPPVKSVANLVPPPPPPPPSTSDNFPVPDSYESFPPFASFDTNPASAPPAAPSPPLPPSVPKPSAPKYQPPVETPAYDSPSDDGGSDSPPMDLGYRYKPPSPPAKPFLPTLPPLSKPFKGYSYDKPVMPLDDSPVMDKPQYHGYHYKKPEAPPSDDLPPSPSYDHHGPPSYQGPDYPELIFNKYHGNDDEGNDMGIMPPPAAPDMDNSGPPSDDHGFPHDFPGDFKYHHDFDDHDFYHHHHHHPTTTTTTTTTEMPRVNRYSYYYLGKKLYYLPLYFSVYFICYVGALIIKAVLRHKIVYPNSFRPNDQTSSFFSKRSVDSWNLSNENLHEITGRVTAAIGKAAEKYMNQGIKQE
ncbi:uncharacterized protein LOC134663220 [Cydia amplana]|uniref:uncharacterized protein LOC134663220 n=1 Tax=Cydia amplana TaxID=1869771 RepID=UPI002FE53EE8